MTKREAAKEIHKYRTEYEMRQSLSNACKGRWTMCIPTNIADDDIVLGDAIHELLERRKENPKRDELKTILDELLRQDEAQLMRSVASFKQTCDGALAVDAIQHRARMGLIREIAWKLGIDLGEDKDG